MKLQDCDWFQDDAGVIWEYQANIDKNQHEWVEIDYWICGIPQGREIDPMQLDEGEPLPKRVVLILTKPQAQERGTES